MWFVIESRYTPLPGHPITYYINITPAIYWYTKSFVIYGGCKAMYIVIPLF